MRRLVYDVGVNDADYMVRPVANGKQTGCPFYGLWVAMLSRCYSDKFQETNPTYAGCSVCKEWLTFSRFKKWAEQQDWVNKQLDKDILVQGNKEYNPDNCIFIPSSLNTLLSGNTARRGKFPLGSSWQKDCGKFISRIKFKGEDKYLGCFHTPQEAHRAWQAAKRDVIYSAAQEQTDNRIKEALLLRCNKLQFDLDHGLETFKL